VKPKDLSPAEQRAAEDALILLPRSIRDKLDKVAIKLHLAEWQTLPMPDREWLRDAPCQTGDEIDTYRTHLTVLVQTHCGKPPDQL